jgi:hypothetical protein
MALVTKDFFLNSFTGYGEAVDWTCLTSHDQGYVLFVHWLWISVDWRCLTSHDQGYVLFVHWLWRSCGLKVSGLS